MRTTILPRTFALVLCFCVRALQAQQEDIPVEPGDSLRALGERIEKRFGKNGIARFQAGLVAGLDARNGGARPRLLRRELELGAPVPKFADGIEGAVIEIPITATLEVESVDGILRHLTFALHQDYRLESASSGGVVLGTERLGAVASATLAQPLGHGARGQVVLRYAARFDRTRDPQKIEDRGFYGRGELFWGRSSVAWYPSLRGQSAPGKLKLRIGRGFRVIGPGTLLEDRPLPDAGDVELRFDAPTDPWFVAGELAKLRFVEDERIYEWVGPLDREDFGRALLARAADVLRWCEARGLPVPPKGAVALQACTLGPPWSRTECWEALFTEPGFTLEPELIAALVGRGWWWGIGFVRTSLDEGLWTYLGRRYAIERNYRDDRGDWWANGDTGRFARLALEQGEGLGSLRALLMGKSPLPELAMRAQMLAGKSALYFRALEHALGKERFDQLLRHVRLFSAGQSIEADVWATLAKERLGVDVNVIAAAWIDAEHLATYEIAAAEVAEQDGAPALRLRVRAGHHPLGLALPVEVVTAAGRERHLLQPEREEQEFLLRTQGAPQSVELDPELLLPRSPRTLAFEPTLESLVGAVARAKRITVVHPAGDRELERANALVERLKSTGTLAREAAALSDAAALERGLPSEGLIAFLGDAATNRAIALLKSSLPLELEERAVKRRDGLRIPCPAGAAARIWWFDPAADTKISLWWTRSKEELPGLEDDQYVLYDGPYPLTRGWLPAKNRLLRSLR
ncbi:MAG: hypothetical protein JNM84_08155 [Planctomycetes bacterium]|nr:hypothetical protein [Planctomycetota bacterium]